MLRPANAKPTDRALKGHLANYDLFGKHLKRAGITHKDALCSVLHPHSFRKTWQTLGVRYGVNQRAAQEVLGHSDANLTAKVYTDMPALGPTAEVAKVPWILPRGGVQAGSATLATAGPPWRTPVWTAAHKEAHKNPIFLGIPGHPVAFWPSWSQQ